MAVDDSDLTQTRQAIVRVHGIDAASLVMVATDEFHFQYLPEYLRSSGPPVSLTLPKLPTPVVTETLHPFFDNLLFEGYLLRLAEKKYGLRSHSAVDRFKLLMLTGREPRGGVSVIPQRAGEGLDVTSVEDPLAEYPVKFVPLENPYDSSCPVCLRQSPKAHRTCVKKLWNTERRITIELLKEDSINKFRVLVPGQSISGAQRKAMFGFREGALSRSGSPLYILKPEGDLREMPANEHLTMAIAGTLGFPAPVFGLYRVDDVGLIYVVKRFDVDVDRNVMLEDFAQLSLELTDQKARATMSTVADVIDTFASSPVIEKAELFRRVLFCFLTGNGDMHLKNWSLIYGPGTPVKLSPIYDLLNVRASFPQEQVEMILSLEGKQSGINREDLISFGVETLSMVDSSVMKTLDESKAWLDIIVDFCQRSALTSEGKERYLAVVHERFATLHR